MSIQIFYFSTTSCRARIRRVPPSQFFWGGSAIECTNADPDVLFLRNILPTAPLYTLIYLGHAATRPRVRHAPVESVFAPAQRRPACRAPPADHRAVQHAPEGPQVRVLSRVRVHRPAASRPKHPLGHVAPSDPDCPVEDRDEVAVEFARPDLGVKLVPAVPVLCKPVLATQKAGRRSPRVSGLDAKRAGPNSSADRSGNR